MRDPKVPQRIDTGFGEWLLAQVPELYEWRDRCEGESRARFICDVIPTPETKQVLDGVAEKLPPDVKIYENLGGYSAAEDPRCFAVFSSIEPDEAPFPCAYRVALVTT